MELIAFRDLPGIVEIERQYLMYLENKLMADEIETLQREIDSKSIELFGITEWDTLFWHLPAEAWTGTLEEWERHFEFIDKPYDEETDFWETFGIDVTDGDETQLACMYVLGRQLICGLRRLHPDAAINFQKGELTDDQLRAAAEAWGRRLLPK